MKYYALLLTGLCLTLSSNAWATRIDFMPLEQLIRDAEFFGVVECETAGTSVARYRVVEAWHGEKEGNLIRIRDPQAGNHYYLPHTLCGQRYVVAAFKSSPSRILSYSRFGTQMYPVAWYKPKYDYTLPLCQSGCIDSKSGEVDFINTKTFTSLNACRAEVQAYYNANADGREAFLLKRMTMYYLRDKKYDDKYLSDEEKTQVAAVAKRLDRLIYKADNIVRELVAMAKDKTLPVHKVLGRVLLFGGSTQTLKYLNDTPKEDVPLDGYREQIIAAALARAYRNLKDELPGAKSPIGEQTRPKGASSYTQRQLVEFADVLKRGPDSEHFGEAFHVLALYEPEPVVKWLKNWTRGKEGHWEGYQFASLFCHLCTMMNEKHCTALLDAADEEVRVTAAIYLCYEDEAAGVTALKKFAALDSAAGAHASLTLARRGHRDAVPRVINFLKPEPVPDAEGEDKNAKPSPRDDGDRFFETRLLVLLSNAAHGSSLPQPLAEAKEGESTYDTLSAWWAKHGERVTVSDPWLKEFAAQQID